MDSYLEIAERVLRGTRRPMSARGILDAAYQANIVPDHLKGKTQHKTLQARLSEDILHRGNDSRFYRTEPGIFFLCEFISAPDVPKKFKEKFPARRRTRDLQRGLPLGVSRVFLGNSSAGISPLSADELFRSAEERGAMRYMLPQDFDDYATIWSFSLVRRNRSFLSYRIGRYRDDRDTFANKRTIGFPGLVTDSDYSLFSQRDYGTADKALSILLLDLDLSLHSFQGGEPIKPKPIFALEAEGDDGVGVLLVVLEWVCPNWFEPTTRRLSLNDPNWLDVSVPPNNPDDFEPWSNAVFSLLYEHGLRQE
ncbi:winged helix-turn-helix domain-containing protein [Roseospira marina]|nr:HTH domain-containing protein [Roseospira marina]